MWSVAGKVVARTRRASGSPRPCRLFRQDLVLGDGYLGAEQDFVSAVNENLGLEM
jgi:hypothetical protein